ncbi:MAG: hypothetical protein PHQ40_19945 [Anaerolineaceae bacterium]|nr:hypothetical protein [Anaerolineaceae bacterium]
MVVNDIVAVAKRELLVIPNYRFSFLFIYLVSFYVGTYLIMPYISLIPTPQIKIDIYLAFFFLATEMAFSWALSTIQILDHMRQRCMETMLATPLSLSSILLGKSLAIFILSYIPSLLCAIIVYLQINAPLGLANLVFPSSIGWIIIFISPVLLFGLICLNTLLLMYLNHSMGGLIVIFGIYLLIFRAGKIFYSGISLTVLGSYILGLLGVFLLSYIGLKLLRKERIVLAL